MAGTPGFRELLLLLSIILESLLIIQLLLIIDKQGVNYYALYILLILKLIINYAIIINWRVIINNSKHIMVGDIDI